VLSHPKEDEGIKRRGVMGLYGRPGMADIAAISLTNNKKPASRRVFRFAGNCRN
jgi:hypothetical protein